MLKSITLTLTEDEAEIIIDALESDLEGYLEAAKEARGNTRRAEVAAFEEAAGRIQAVRDRVRSLLD